MSHLYRHPADGSSSRASTSPITLMMGNIMEDDEFFPSSRPHRRRCATNFCFKYCVWPSILVLLILSLLLGVGDLLISNSTSDSGQQVWTNCGNSPAEARHRGCSFDMLSHAWLPKECYDDEISTAYRRAGSWEYYLDQHGKYPISEVEVAEGETDVWLREGQHYVHCTFMWRQMHRAFTVLHYIDDHLNNPHHTTHCQKIFLEKRSGDLLEVLARVIYPNCHPV
jgi:hypothetical protein